MKGFKINVKDEEICAYVNRGTIVIVVEKTYVSIMGTDRGIGLSKDWGTIEVGVGDKIKIVASESDSCSQPIKTESVDRQELITEYYKLKEFLTKEGKLK